MEKPKIKKNEVWNGTDESNRVKGLVVMGGDSRFDGLESRMDIFHIYLL